MAEMLSPGVYTIENDYSEYVADVSSCVIGIVGGAKKGPVGVPTLVTNQTQMIEIFGSPTEGEFGVYSALAALSQASQVYYTRVVNKGVKATANGKGILYVAKDIGDKYNGYKIVQSIGNTVSEGNTHKDEDGTFKSNYVIEVKDDKDSVLETFRNFSFDANDKSEEYYIENIGKTSEYIDVIVLDNPMFAATTINFAGGVDQTCNYSKAGETDDRITFRSKYYDSEINGYQVVTSDIDAFGFFDVILQSSNGSESLESFYGLSLDPKSDRYVETIINSASKYFICVDNGSEKEYSGNTRVFTGGQDGIEGLSAIDIIGEGNGTGLYSFSNPEAIDIDLLAAPGWSDAEVITNGIAICEDRGECLYIADAPQGYNAQEVIEWSNGNARFDSSYGALYWPWVKVSDSFTKKNIWLPPSGYVLAQYAYNDQVAFPWSAPAGINRGAMAKPIAIEFNTTKGERDAVYGNRNIVNPLTNLLGNGIVIWGQKTMQRSPSSLDRVNVRRLMNYLKKSITLATKQFVFEQNTESTWERWENMVEPILSDVQANDGIYEYKIEINPTISDVENSRMPVSVSVKPSKSAEFIPLTFNVMAYSASFEDKLD